MILNSSSLDYPFQYNVDKSHGLYLEKLNEFDIRLIRKNNTDIEQSYNSMGRITNHLLILNKNKELYRDVFISPFDFNINYIPPKAILFDTMDIYNHILYNGKNEKYFVYVYDNQYDVTSNKVEIKLDREKYDRMSYFENHVELSVEYHGNSEILVIVRNNLDFKFYLKHLYMQAETIGPNNTKVFQLRENPFLNSNTPTYLKPNQEMTFRFNLCEELLLKDGVELKNLYFIINNKTSNNHADLFLDNLKCE